MPRTMLALALFGAALLAATGAEPTKPEPKLSKKDIARMMKEAHTGAKSPHGRTLDELAKEQPNWEQVAKDAKAFVAMADAFKRTDLGYNSPVKYADGAAALAKAAGDKDKTAAAEAFGGLTKSCSACHAYK